MIPIPHISNNTNSMNAWKYFSLLLWTFESRKNELSLVWICFCTITLLKTYKSLLMLRTGAIWWRNKKIDRTLNNTDTTTEKRTKNGFRKSKKQSNVLSNSGYKPWYYVTLLRIWGWTFKGCKQTDPTPSFFPCDYEYSWRIGTSQTQRDADSLVKKLRKN